MEEIEKHCKSFYIRTNRCSSLYNDIFALRGWKTEEINGIVLKGAKDKNDKEYMLGVLEREREGLLKIMDQYYEAHSTIKETEKASLCKTFKALPEDADIKAYWRTKHSRMVLILKTDGEDPINSEYYVHAEPIK